MSSPRRRSALIALEQSERRVAVLAEEHLGQIPTTPVVSLRRGLCPDVLALERRAIHIADLQAETEVASTRCSMSPDPRQWRDYWGDWDAPHRGSPVHRPTD